MPTKPADATPDIATPDVPSDTPSTVKVRVPQDSGTIIITTFDSKTPNRYPVTGGVIDAPTQADADLLVARVDGASLI